MGPFSRRLGVCLAVVLPIVEAWAASGSRAETSSWERLGVRQGLCVVVGDGAVPRAVELAGASQLSVYVQCRTAEDFEAAARTAEQAGLLGKRVFVERGPWSRLHLADDLVDVVVVEGSAAGPGGVPRGEVLRVLRPGGRALLGGEESVKPFPPNTDDWSHPYHGPDNNPQSADQVARAPYLTQFLAEPSYSPMPLVTVASGGRLFKAFGHVAIKQREWPLLNTLVAQNAFNGTLLWQRKLSPNFMIHRSTMIATPETLFLADDVSCKLLDAATGEVRGEIVSAADDGAVWKWMALQDGVLYALVGKSETPDPTVRGDRRDRGWPWGPPLGQGYNSKDYPWGFGQTILALDVATRQVIWRHREVAPIDTRAMCMAAGRIFFYSHGKFLGALAADSGKVLWRTSDAELMAAIGPHRFAQNPTEGFSTSAYVKCNARGLYFAGPIRTDLVGVSAENGRLLWRRANGGNSQLVLRENGLYAMGPGQSVRLDFGTGEVLESLGPRVNCTRATGSADSIFVRGGRDGTMRYDLVQHRQQHICPMRPSCQDGVLIAHGHLFWGPWMCDCNLTLVGVVSLAPAGDFDFQGDPNAAERLESPPAAASLPPFEIVAADWPTLRANNARTATSQAPVPEEVRRLWTFEPPGQVPASAPTAAGGMIFLGGQDGVVRAVDAATGTSRWTAYTAGPIRYPPALWQGRAIVGSGDGWIYCFEAASGRPLWRYRAAPAERAIPVYGSLHSTWPVASGVLVENGIAYAAAGMANHDGTHVFALDAATGKPRWHNATSGSLDPETSSGVSVNGHLLLHGEQLYLAGGNMVPVAAYRLADGACLTDPNAPRSHTQFTAGSDLFLVAGRVYAGGPPLYSRRGDYRIVKQAVLQTPAGDLMLAYGPHDGAVAWCKPGEGTQQDVKPRWQARPLNRVSAVALAANAVVLAGLEDSPQIGEPPQARLVALSTEDGQALWSEPLPSQPVPWGLLVDRAGRIVATLDNGAAVCFAGP